MGPCCSGPSCIIGAGSQRWEANMPCTTDHQHAHRDDDDDDDDDDDADNGHDNFQLKVVHGRTH